jgi:hypothetical protein
MALTIRLWFSSCVLALLQPFSPPSASFSPAQSLDCLHDHASGARQAQERALLLQLRCQAKKASRFTQAPSTSLVRRDRGNDEPPMAFVEEEIPTEPIIIPSASLLYIVPDPHDPPNTSHSFPVQWYLRLGNLHNSGRNLVGRPPNGDPPPPSTAPDRDSCSTCFLSPEHLELIFEMRRDMQEQLHRHTLLNSRLDILYDALSGSQSQQRCPTCAQPFVFTPTGGTHDDTGFTGSSTA